MVYMLLPLATMTPLPQPYCSVLMDLTDRYSFQVRTDGPDRQTDMR